MHPVIQGVWPTVVKRLPLYRKYARAGANEYVEVLDLNGKVKDRGHGNEHHVMMPHIPKDKRGKRIGLHTHPIDVDFSAPDWSVGADGLAGLILVAPSFVSTIVPGKQGWPDLLRLFSLFGWPTLEPRLAAMFRQYNDYRLSYGEPSLEMKAEFQRTTNNIAAEQYGWHHEVFNV